LLYSNENFIPLKNFETHLGTKFHQIPPSEIPIVTCGHVDRTNGYKEANSNYL